MSNSARASYVYTYAGIEFQRITAGRGLGIAVYHAYLVAQLVDEYADGLGLGDAGRELAQRLRHESRLQSHFRVAHVALDLGLRRQSRHRVYDDDVYGARSDKRIGYFERLFAVVGLRYEQVVDVYAQLLCVVAVECVLGIDECRYASRFLGLGYRMYRQRRLTRRLGTVYLYHATFGVSSHAERHVERYRARRYYRYVCCGLTRHAHDRALAEILLYLVHNRRKHFELVGIYLLFVCHNRVSCFYRFSYESIICR